MLARHGTGICWIGLHPLYEVHRRQVLNECGPALILLSIAFKQTKAGPRISGTPFLVYYGPGRGKHLTNLGRTNP